MKYIGKILWFVSVSSVVLMQQPCTFQGSNVYNNAGQFVGRVAHGFEGIDVLGGLPFFGL